MDISKQQAAIEKLLNYFDHFMSLNKDEKDLVVSKFRWRSYRKHQYVLQEGEICKYFNFVVSGCLRSYKIDSEGNIHILKFAIEDWWINDLGSFHSMEPSELSIDALEDTEVLQISHDDLIELYRQAPKFDSAFRMLVERAYVNLQKRLLKNISSTGEERYNHFVECYPLLLNRLSQKQIAAYLGVTPEFLSRVKKKLIVVQHKS